MNRRLITIAAGITLVATVLLAQAGPGGRGGPAGVGAGFQQFGGVPGFTAEQGWFTGADHQQVTLTLRPLNSTPVTGSPVSATEERRTVQTLGDGTVLENADTNLFYRDSQGRTRIERTIQGKTSIVITDPVAHIVARLDPATRTVHKSNMPAAPGPSGSPEQLQATIEGLRAEVLVRDHIAPAPGASDAAITHEDLGTLSQNGVPAQGTRATMTIPAGKIGNNRDIRVVNERWYSNELQMMVKSVNSDPRFGTTTYQLTNILRANPDLGLFQIPPDYTVIEGGGRGAVSKSGR